MPNCVICDKKVDGKTIIMDNRYSINFKGSPSCNPCFKLWAAENHDKLLEIIRNKLLKISRGKS